MVGIATLLGMFGVGAAFSGGFSSMAAIGAPITSYRQAYAFAQGYGEGMVPGLYRNAAIEDQIQKQRQAEQRVFDMQSKILDWTFNLKMREYERKTAVPRTRYRLVY